LGLKRATSAQVESLTMKLGDLVVELGLVSQKDLNEALQIGKDTGLPIGRVLTMSAFLTELQLQAALRAQEMLKEGSIDIYTVKEAVRQVNDGKTIEEAFAAVGVAKSEVDTTVPLGELFVKSGLLTAEQVEFAVEQCKSTGLPIGRLLLLSGLISETSLTAALNAQILVRDGRITKQQAVEGLKGAKRRQISIESSLAERGVYAEGSTQPLRLGELLVQANIISLGDVMNAIEIGLIQDKPIGQILLELDRLDDALLQYALKLQSDVKTQIIAEEVAIEALARAKQRGVPQDVALAQGPQPASEEPPTLVKFLKQVGRLNDENIAGILQMVVKDNELTKGLMLRGELVDQNSIEVSTQLLSMIENKTITPAWAAIVFRHCMSENVSVTEALHIITAGHKKVVTGERSIAAEPASPTPAAPAQGPTLSEQLAASKSRSSRSRTSLPPVPPPKLPVTENGKGASSDAKPSPKISQSHPNSAIWDDARKLAEEFCVAGDWEEAEKHWFQAMKVAEPLGENDPRFAYSLEKLGESFLNQKKYQDAEPILLRAHTLKLKILGEEHLSLATSLNSLSKLYYYQSRYEQAESLARQFILLIETNLGTEHPDVACGVHNLATLYHVNGRFDQAEEQYIRALEICRKILGNEHPNTIKLLKSYAALLKTLHRDEEAEHLDACVKGTISGSWKDFTVQSNRALQE
jgi:tetratricopeptide (TPR) repeat protein